MVCLCVGGGGHISAERDFFQVAIQMYQQNGEYGYYYTLVGSYVGSPTAQLGLTLSDRERSDSRSFRF